MICTPINTTTGVKSNGPMVGKTRLIGVNTGSVSRYNTSTTGANGLPDEMGKNDEIARASTTKTYKSAMTQMICIGLVTIRVEADSRLQEVDTATHFFHGAAECVAKTTCKVDDAT